MTSAASHPQEVPGARATELRFKNERPKPESSVESVTSIFVAPGPIAKKATAREEAEAAHKMNEQSQNRQLLRAALLISPRRARQATTSDCGGVAAEKALKQSHDVAWNQPLSI
jgi:hypothetical protein